MIRLDVSTFSYFFSKNGLPTLLPLDETKNVGQRTMMTETDIEKVRRHYNCSVLLIYFLYPLNQSIHLANNQTCKAMREQFQ